MNSSQYFINSIHIYVYVLYFPTAGLVHSIEALVGDSVHLPCDVTAKDPQTRSPDLPVLVLWYKDGLGTPIYRWAMSSENRSRNASVLHPYIQVGNE